MSFILETCRYVRVSVASGAAEERGEGYHVHRTGHQTRARCAGHRGGLENLKFLLSTFDVSITRRLQMQQGDKPAVIRGCNFPVGNIGEQALHHLTSCPTL